MIDKKALEQFIEKELEDTSYFLVETSVTADNVIKVEIDSLDSVDIDFCIDLSRKIEAEFPREPEDYELEVGSAGFTSPFKVRKQYEKNIGNEVEVMARDGKKYTGVLQEAGDSDFAILATVKEKPAGAKRPVEVTREMRFTYDAVNSVKYLFKF
ncbi:MAG: ribosome assembly cofactor RimP [Muribaculaceae bacterium]|nr:ribosome assembly cofactor RimP [Muribaculaceae bacterium]